MLKDRTLWQIALGALVFAAAVSVIVAAFLICQALGRFWKNRFPPPALWQQPREVSALFDNELCDALKLRLVLVEQDQRAALWQDRETGQLWSAFAWDFEFTENVVFTPITHRSDWRGMDNSSAKRAADKPH